MVGLAQRIDTAQGSFEPSPGSSAAGPASRSGHPGASPQRAGASLDIRQVSHAFDLDGSTLPVLSLIHI